MKTFTVEVTQTVIVTLDETKFDDAFMADFQASFFSFDSLEEHAEHLAQLHARGIVDIEDGDEFVEGYGPAASMGLRATIDYVDTVLVAKGGAA